MKRFLLSIEVDTEDKEEEKTNSSTKPMLNASKTDHITAFFVELLKQAHTTQLAQQADTAVKLEYLIVIVGIINKQFKSLKAKLTKRMKLE